MVDIVALPEILANTKNINWMQNLNFRAPATSLWGCQATHISLLTGFKTLSFEKYKHQISTFFDICQAWIPCTQ